MISFSTFSHAASNSSLAKIKIVIAQQQIIVNLLDTPASQQLLLQLPLTLNFSDYVGAEKIAYLPKKLVTQGMVSAVNIAGDFTYYAPWGNLAIFYRSEGHDGNLYTLGHIESGKEVLASLTQNFTATISRVE